MAVTVFGRLSAALALPSGESSSITTTPETLPVRRPRLCPLASQRLMSVNEACFLFCQPLKTGTLPVSAISAHLRPIARRASSIRSNEALLDELGSATSRLLAELVAQPFGQQVQRRSGLQQVLTRPESAS